jgi:hydroxymethylglutaryl-CoA reductase
MAQTRNSSSERSRISLEVAPSFHRFLEEAAAAHDQTVVQYILEAIEERLRLDSDDAMGANVVIAAADPVLAELWDNDNDAEYDRL